MLKPEDTYFLCTIPSEIIMELAQFSGEVIEEEVPLHQTHISDSTNNLLKHVLLSRYTLLKQLKHPEIPIGILDSTPATTIDNHFTSMVQLLMEKGECIRETRSQYKHHLLFFLPVEYFPNCIAVSQHEGKLVKLVLKITTELNAIYLQSIHLVDRNRFLFEKQRGKTIFSSTLVHSNQFLTYRD